MKESGSSDALPCQFIVELGGLTRFQMWYFIPCWFSQARLIGDASKESRSGLLIQLATWMSQRIIRLRLTPSGPT